MQTVKDCFGLLQHTHKKKSICQEQRF